MRQLLPSFHEDADPARGYGDPPRRNGGSRPYVLVNMVSGVDGGTTTDGVSGGLGSAADRRIFAVLRSAADIILAGAQTVRAERYGPPEVDETLAAGRRARGQAEVPAIAVISRSLRLDWASPLFSATRRAPLVIAPASAGAGALAPAAHAAEGGVAGDERVDVAEALDQLGRRGAAVVLCEGGPTLIAELLEHDLVDELCLTLSPVLLGAAGGNRITGGAVFDHPHRLSLTHVFEEDDFLFLRYALTPTPEEARP